MTTERFEWRLVWFAMFFGLVFAGLTITGSLPDVGTTKWAALAVIGVVGLRCGVSAPQRPFRHGFVAGFAAGLVAVEAQALFFPAYLHNNPLAAELEMPFGWPPRVVTAVLGPLNALLGAIVAGSLAWIIHRGLRSQQVDTGEGA